MPVYHYQPEALPCRLCGDGFEHRAPATARALNTCPTCGQTVQRRPVQTVNVMKLSRPPAVSTAKSAGFTVLRRLGSGEYERQ